MSKRVETARIVRRGPRYRIEFGEEFLERELDNDQDLQFVLLHEVYHHVLGHLDAAPSFPRTPAWEYVVSIAADMMVNRVVCDRYFNGGVPLLKRLYSAREIPSCLLLPPAVHLDAEMNRVARMLYRWRGGRRPRPPNPRNSFCSALRLGGVAPDVARQAWGVYSAAWQEDTPFERLCGMVADLLKASGTGGEWILLLGDHQRGREPIDGLPWPGEHRDGGGLAGWSDDLAEEELDEPAEPAVSPELVQAIRMALEADPNHPRRRLGYDPTPSVLYSPGRSDYLFIAMGVWPSMFHGPRFQHAIDDLRAHVYIDVSGSVRDWIGRIYGLVLGLGEEVGSPVHLFSNRVVDASLDDLAAGRVATTSGTDFDCVIRHALDHRHRRIVVITDGLGELAPDLGAAFAEDGGALYLVLMGVDRESAMVLSPLPGIAREVWELGGETS